MITLPFGAISILAVLAYAFMGGDAAALLNLHSIVIVVVGTVAVLLFSTPLRNILGLIRALRDLKTGEVSNDEMREAVFLLSKNRNNKFDKFIHPLFNYAQDLWAQGIDKNIFEVLLSQRIEELNARTEQPVSALRNLAKYPPALGMVGTVIGMISLFGNLSDDNKGNIGPALALAMTATFYGLAVANFFIMPLSDRLHVRHLSRVKRNELVFNSIVLINRNEPRAVLESCVGEVKIHETAA